MPHFPQQVAGLDLTPVEDGLIVNDHSREKVHYLNHTAGLVLTLCNGRNSIQKIARLLQKQFKLPEVPKQEVVEILEEFKNEGLVNFEKL